MEQVAGLAAPVDMQNVAFSFTDISVVQGQVRRRGGLRNMNSSLELSRSELLLTHC